VDEKGEFVNFLDANAGVVTPDKRQSVVRLEQVGPGRYRGRFPAADEGAYVVGVTERKDQKLLGSEVGSLVVPYSPEHRALQPNEGLLRDVAALSAGAAPAEPGQNFTESRRTAQVRVEAWPYLLALALLLFLPDVALRRLWFGWARARAAAGGEGPAPPPSVPVTGRFGTRARRA
jgi:hypothetical protein